ncbi:MAG: hypothetical protein ACRDKA_11405 [Actinomycetota bacterium]
MPGAAPGFSPMSYTCGREQGEDDPMNDMQVIRGARLRELPRPNRTYAQGRVCAHEGCETRLSVYNKAKYCWSHKPVTYPIVRGERKRTAA